MELHFLGRGAAFYAEEGNTAAYFVEDKKLFLIDCGETIFAHLKEHRILEQVEEVYAVISHTHSDHCGSIGSLGLYCQFVLKNKLKLIIPHDAAYTRSLRDLMNIFGNTENAYELIYEEKLDGMFRNFSKVRYQKTRHDYVLTCFSFVFETDKGAVFYSSDTRTTETLLAFLRKYKDVDCIFMEVTDLVIPGDVHLRMDVLEQAVTEEIKAKMKLMHLRSKECTEILAQRGFQFVEINE